MDNYHDQNIILVNKQLGESCGQLLTRLRSNYPGLSKSTMTYVGKLDPMASGLMVVLADEARFQAERYKGLSKVYQCQILFGLGSDSNDVLGKLRIDENFCFDTDKFRDLLSQQVGWQTQIYHPFSGVKWRGKPMFEWAKNQVLTSNKTNLVNIEEIVFMGCELVDVATLVDSAVDRINKVQGEFRQKQITKDWLRLKNNESIHVARVSIEVRCSSGTYIRSLVANLAKRLNTQALVWSLHRSKVGSYHESDVNYE